MTRRIGDYEIQEKIGRGAYATVYKGTSLDNKEFALKIVKKSDIRSQVDFMHLKLEINTLKNIKHPNIIRYYDFVETEEAFCIVEEYFNGSDLFDYIVEKERLKSEEAALIFRQIASAVSFLHSLSVVHRDLKPQNILIDRNKHVKLIDFGLCHYLQKNMLLTSFSGSPCYSPPEYLKMEPYDGKKCDMWSLGVDLYEMVTGQHPWNITNAAVMNKQILTATYMMPNYVDKGAADLISKLLQVQPNNRIAANEIFEHPWIKKYCNEGCKLCDNNDRLPTLIKRSTSLDIGKQDFSSCILSARRFRITRIDQSRGICLGPRMPNNRSSNSLVF